MSTDHLAADILTALKSLLGNRWAKFNAKDRQVIEACAADAAEVSLQSLAGVWDFKKAEREKRQITAQVANVKSAGEGAIVDLFWSAVRFAVRGAMAVVLA